MFSFRFYVNRLFNMDFKRMFEMIDKVREKSGKNKIVIFFDMIHCSLRYQSGYMDYYYFDFASLNRYQRSTYITRGVNSNYINYLNNKEASIIFDNKTVFNKKFSEFIKRDFIDLQEANYECFANFCIKHNTFIAKPVNADCGRNVEKIHVKETDMKQEYDKLIENEQFLLEENIEQIDKLSELHPNSVNTIRMVTITRNNKTSIVFQLIRIGNGDSIVDNFHNGGMYAIIKDGVVSSNAIDKNNVEYEFHPTTGVRIKGLEIPYYSDIVEMINRASRIVPEVGLVGWDVAVTEQGPLLVEGNNIPAYDFYQSQISFNEDGTGIKPLFDKAIYGGKNE